MIAQDISHMIAEAMKARDEIRLSTLKMLSSALNYEKIAKQHDLNDEEEMVVVRREAKKRTDAIEVYNKAEAVDRAEKEAKELEVLKTFLPPDISDEDLAKIVEESITQIGAVAISDMGKVMGVVMSKTNGAADGKKVADLVKSKLT